MRVVRIFLSLLLLLIMVLCGLDAYMRADAKPNLYSSVKKIPPRDAALLLGTAKYVAKGKKNYFYLYRIRAAVELFESGKIRAILISGDNATRYYNELATMQEDLIRAGIPKSYITLDYAGFRTLDSIIRAEAIFDLKDYIVISQKFHLERALFIAKAKGHNAIGFIAKDIPGTSAAYRMKLREYLARVKAFLDVYILGTDPKFYGEKVKVNYRE